MKNLFCFVLGSILMFLSQAQPAPFGQDNLVKLLDEELSGESAKRNLEYISRLHRMRGSDDYNKATAFIREKLSEYHLEEIELIQIPADGKIMYGTQKSRPAWNVQFAELWELKEIDGKWQHFDKIADWESIPMVVAQDSYSGDVDAELVDVGSGRSDTDYEGKEISGKLVLTSSQPGAIVPLAIEKYGASGILSYAQNQRSAWWKEDENLIRWGHLETFEDTKTFGFMVSLKQARSFQQRLGSGEKIMLHAKVEAETQPGTYDILMAKIVGADRPDEEIVFTCHLDHPRPGANDNASGCVAILEVARAIKKLIDEEKLERPGRTLRFIWSPEIEGTTALLNYRPNLAGKIIANIHMDMVGGTPNTKAVYHVSRSPVSVPSVVNDIGEAFGEFLNNTSNLYAAGSPTDYPMASSEGGREALNARLGEFHMGSDFQVFTEGSWRIPAIYLHEYPDRYIHTNYDTPANIDPTKLKRSAFLGAASACYLANIESAHWPRLFDVMKSRMLLRIKEQMDYASQLSPDEGQISWQAFWVSESERLGSLGRFFKISDEQAATMKDHLMKQMDIYGGGENKIWNGFLTVYQRNSDIKGPMSVFGYNYFQDNYKLKKATPRIFSYQGVRGSGGMYAYEALNLVNGSRTVSDIRNVLSFEFGPIPVELIQEYMDALESINVVQK